MKIKVIEDCYYVSEDLSSIGLVGRDEFENSFSHLLVKGDIWESVVDEGNFSYQIFKCIKGDKWEGEESDGWWDYEGNECYFEVIEE
jgi:hypothetical protein